MALFQAKLGGDLPKKRQKNFRTKYSFYLTRAGAFPKKFKKILKEFKKIKNTFLSSFHAKLGWDRRKKRLKKFRSGYRFSRPWLGSTQKNSIKIQKIKNLHSS